MKGLRIKKVKDLRKYTYVCLDCQISKKSLNGTVCSCGKTMTRIGECSPRKTSARWKKIKKKYNESDEYLVRYNARYEKRKNYIGKCPVCKKVFQVNSSNIRTEVCSYYNVYWSEHCGCPVIMNSYYETLDQPTRRK